MQKKNQNMIEAWKSRSPVPHDHSPEKCKEVDCHTLKRQFQRHVYKLDDKPKKLKTGGMSDDYDKYITSTLLDLTYRNEQHPEMRAKSQ